MDTQTYDASRLFATQTGPSCSQSACPRCSCPFGKSFGDKWFHEYQDPSRSDINSGTVRCGECECKDDGDGILYAHCEYVSWNFDGLSSCPASDVTNNTVLCHRQYEFGGVTMEVNNLSTVTCESSPYCEWRFEPFENHTGWGCEPIPIWLNYIWDVIPENFCEAYANGECVHYQTSITYTNCEGNITEETRDEYQKCCNAVNEPNCNHEDIDISSCKQMDDPELKYKECWYSSDVYEQYICDDPVTDISCDAVKAVFLESARCKCEYLWSPMYNGLEQTASKYQKYVAGLINNEYLKLIEALGCNITFDCNLTSGAIIGIDGDTSGTTTLQPTYVPSVTPSSEPSNEPSTTTTTTIDIRTTTIETHEPSMQPVMRTHSPSTDPTTSPTLSRLSMRPSESPFIATTYRTSLNPSEVPTRVTTTTDLTTTIITYQPSTNPSEESSESPSIMTTYRSSMNPSESPSALIAVTDAPSDCDEDKKNGNKGSGKNKDKKGYSALSNKLIADHWKKTIGGEDQDAFEHSLMINLVILSFSVILLILALYVWCKQRESWVANDKNDV